MYVDVEVTKAPTAQVATRRRRNKLILLGYALIAPAIIWRLAVAIYPFLNTVFQSFTNSSPLAGVPHFVGLDNYIRIFHDPVIVQSLSFTFIFTVASTSIQLVYALAIALLLNRAFRGRGFVRAINLLPWAMPAIVIATASQWMFNSQYGMIVDLVYGLTQGGPGNATTVLSYQVYQLAFTGLYYGYGSALAVFAFIVVATLSLIFFTFMRRSERAL